MQLNIYIYINKYIHIDIYIYIDNIYIYTTCGNHCLIYRCSNTRMKESIFSHCRAPQGVKSGLIQAPAQTKPDQEEL